MFDLRQTLDLIEEGAFDEAATALQRAIAQMPAYTPAYVLLAQTFEAQERWPEALEAWQRARFFAPNSPAVQSGLMRALDHQDIVPDTVATPEVRESEAADADTPDAADQAATELLDTIRDAGDTTAPAPDAGWGEASPAEEAEEPAPSELPSDEPAPEPSEPTAPPTDPEEPSLGAEPETGEDTDTGEVDVDEAPPPQEPPPPEPAEPDAEANEPEPDRAQPDESTDDVDPAVPAAESQPSTESRSSPLEDLARRLPDADQPLPDDLQDLDRLIDELEGARIDPQPDVSDAPEPDLESDIDDMVSETLARIYISQNQYEEAARVYLRLASQEPEQAKEHLEKAAELRDQARDLDAEN